MKTELKKTPLALAIAALIASPMALANDEGDIPEETGFYKLATKTSSTETETDHKSSNEVEITKHVRVRVTGDVTIPEEVAPSSAVVNSTQSSTWNSTNNWVLDNNSHIEGDAMSEASGNLGANTASGDNNQQANDAALAASDAEFVFADAETFSHQDAEANMTMNTGVRNNTGVGGNALSNAAGNIGVNVASGNSNQQQNSLAASHNSASPYAVATSGGLQTNDLNQTQNMGDYVVMRDVTRITLSVNSDDPLSGSYEGTSDQIGDVYPDVWEYNPEFDADEQHPNSPRQISHFDLDTQTQGGSDLNDDGGALAYNEVGDVELDSGSMTGSVVNTFTRYRPARNNSSIDGSALSGASGNIGVNVASGTNNQQRNSMAIAAAEGSTLPGGLE